LGNGGFGPGYGILGLRDGHATYCETALDGYRHQRYWPRRWQQMAAVLLPICDWGGGVVSLVDCSTRTARIWALCPEPHWQSCGEPRPGSFPKGALTASLFREHLGLTEWLRRWIDGTLHQPAAFRDERSNERSPNAQASVTASQRGGQPVSQQATSMRCYPCRPGLGGWSGPWPSESAPQLH
ncbi:MAG: hypothetical protein JXA67_22390, partial [Micromonosporaceae bacterium]|nr:hypothetical protein [Micromonosporaceae bacterium]